MQRDKLKELIVKSGKWTEDLEYLEYSECYIRYEDDAWSGTAISYRIDKGTGLLLEDTSNDSPEQAGGWVVRSVYYNGDWYNISSIADRFTYAIIDNVVYLVEYEYMLFNSDARYGSAIVMNVATKEDADPSDTYYRYKFLKDKIDIHDMTEAEFRAFAIEKFKEGEFTTEHYNSAVSEVNAFK